MTSLYYTQLGNKKNTDAILAMVNDLQQTFLILALASLIILTILNISFSFNKLYNCSVSVLPVSLNISGLSQLS